MVGVLVKYSVESVLKYKKVESKGVFRVGCIVHGIKNLEVSHES
jgi:hypothetical protein